MIYQPFQRTYNRWNFTEKYHTVVQEEFAYGVVKYYCLIFIRQNIGWMVGAGWYDISVHQCLIGWSTTRTIIRNLNII